MTDLVDEINCKQIKILGAYGTKAKGFGTSSIYLNAQNIIDAGNLLNGLGDKCIEIENIYLTHSHLDHICDIAYVIDHYFNLRKKSLNIIGLPQTIEDIKKHFLNDIIWPDFSKIALDNSDEMAIVYKELTLDREYKLNDKESIKAFKTDHTVASCGYIYKSDNSSIMITADTYSLESAISELEKDLSIKTLIVECSFSSNMEKLAQESKHLTSKTLFKELKKLDRDDIGIYINHMKPAFIKEIKYEIEQYRGKREVKLLKDGEILNF